MSFQAISCSRWIFLGTLLVSAVGLATAVYFVLENEQVEDFQVEVSRCCLSSGLYNRAILPTTR